MINISSEVSKTNQVQNQNDRHTRLSVTKMFEDHPRSRVRTSNHFVLENRSFDVLLTLDLRLRTTTLRRLMDLIDLGLANIFRYNTLFGDERNWPKLMKNLQKSRTISIFQIRTIYFFTIVSS